MDLERVGELTYAHQISDNIKNKSRAFGALNNVARRSLARQRALAFALRVEPWKAKCEWNVMN